VASWLEIATLTVAAIGGGRAIIEYVRAGRWKAAELAAAQIAALAENSELSFACHALDWGVGPLIVPDRYKPIAGCDVIQHDPKVLELALEPILNASTLKNSAGLSYRYAFDRLFDHLDRVDSMIARRLFKPDDVASLEYYLDQVVNYRYASTVGKQATTFPPFIEAYGYRGVLRLRDRIKKSNARSKLSKIISRL
jgi:hypothetical protein